ncbi:hypothetical protein [Dechloromonas sp.]|uniref:hypothetical protein n=1 Tax=Dechloromonas sp. TaxID=1917218 RepID=UPI00286E3A10|nr:hypothetical protein [Dechloromonas sp.]
MAVMMSEPVPNDFPESIAAGWFWMPAVLAGAASGSPRAACNCSRRRAMARSCLLSGLVWRLKLCVERMLFDSLFPKNAVADSMMPLAGRGDEMATGLILWG